MKVLFVCGGNTCRSPMAAGLASSRWGDLVDVTTAGVAHHGNSPTADAIAVVRDRCGVDISGHRPRGLERVEMAAFDYIIAMDSYVARCLREERPVPMSRLVEWSIADPYLKGRKVYEACADQIIRELDAFKPRLASGGPMAISHSAETPAADATATSPSPAGLCKKIAEWQAELETGQLRDTLLQGIAKKAVDSFEVVFRKVVETARTLARDTKDIDGKPFGRLTLGELIEYMAQNDKALTAAVRATPRGARLLAKRRLLTPTLRRPLDGISSLRNDLHHRPNHFARDAKTLEANSRRLMTLLDEALGDIVFELTEPDFLRESAGRETSEA